MTDNITRNMHTAKADKIEDVDIDDEMEQSYIDYAMSVIAGRALPDARDGLKPVHRRLLYTMYTQGITSTSSHRKSSSVVGETMGNFHPHGDSAIYQALARLSQDFSMRVPLIDGQGNFGSIDGDSPAAMRYTEARMDDLGEALLEDIDSDTVTWSSNYDGRLEEPDVLPAAVPQLLINGSSGIAVGMSTNMPPHNATEIRDAVIHKLHNPDATTEDLREFVTGPDFPTGGVIVGTDGLDSAYKTGRGKITMQASYETPDENTIIITELPYQTDKSKLVEKLANLVSTERIEGITDIVDESDKSGVRIVISLKKSVIPEVVENKLLDTVLTKTFGIINLALVDGQPKVLSLNELIQIYINHRKDVLTNRTQSQLEDATAEQHLVDGRITAVENVETVIETIKNADSRTDAKDQLQETLDFSEKQVNSIVRMQIGSLTSAELSELQNTHDDLTASIERYQEILSNESTLRSVVETELRDAIDPLCDDRRTTIKDSYTTMTEKDLIPDDPCVILHTTDGYIKRVDANEFSEQNRNGKGVRGISLSDNAQAHTVHSATAHDTLYCFTDSGRVYTTPVFNIPESGRNARGTHAVNLFDITDDETITTTLTVSDDIVSGDNTDHSLCLVTTNGRIKRTDFTEYQTVYDAGKSTITLEDNATVSDAVVIPNTDTDVDILMSTNTGYTIRFSASEVSKVGRTAKGVRGIKLQDNAKVVSAVGIKTPTLKPAYLLTVTENGNGKRTNINNFRTQSRYGKGVIDIKTSDENGSVVTTTLVTDDDTVLLTETHGNVLKVPVKQLSTISRNSKGYSILNTDNSLSSATRE